MAAVIGDFVPDLSRFHSMISGSSSSSIQTQTQQQQQHHHHHHRHQDQPSHDASSSSASASAYRSSSRSQPSPAAPRSQQRSDSAIQHSSSTSASRPAQQGQAQGQTSAGQPVPHTASSSTGGASQFPSPPPSSSPTVASGPAAPDDAKSASMAPQIEDAVSSTGQAQQQPSPPSDDFQAPRPGQSSASSSYLVSSSAPSRSMPEQNIIHVRDLAHIETMAKADLDGTANGSAGILHDPPLHQVKYEISSMPIADVIEMVAALLTKITSTNDQQHDATQRNVAHQQQANQNAESTGGSQMSPLSHSVLAFHGRNVPSITILSYLSRIHKYCPTTFEVFLSLLVYFDRMTERVNDMVIKSEDIRRQTTRPRPSQSATSQQDTPMQDDAGGSDESDSDLADDDDEDDDDDVMADSPTGSSRRVPTERSTVEPPSPLSNPATYFVVDSFNIHRLIIAGVTCASKFFSDVFYTNSRYAKVGGLPLPELNHLELQFLVLNDFRLAVPVEDLEAYATMLVEFYAREVVAPTIRVPE